MELHAPTDCRHLPCMALGQQPPQDDALFVAYNRKLPAFSSDHWLPLVFGSFFACKLSVSLAARASLLTAGAFFAYCGICIK